MENYEDPMGRDTSLNVIKEKIAACKEKGIRPFAYGAVYAATKNLLEEHPDWAVYTLVQVKVLLDKKIKGVYWASPDENNQAKPLDFETKVYETGRCQIVTLPELEIWDILWLETEE